MADSHDPREERVQKAFDEAAEDLGFDLEESSFAEGEHYGVGFIPLVGRKLAVCVPKVEFPEDVSEEDRKEVISLVEAWESVHPNDLPKVWHNYVTDPVMLVDPSGVIPIGGEEMEASAKDTTRTVEETMADGSKQSTEIVHLLIKTLAGWRIAVLTKELVR